MIRQAISCDICGTEMQNPNHWFVVFDRDAEFRMSRWNSRTRLRADSRHLCGQTCLHKLVDEYMARTVADRVTTPEAQLTEKKPQPAAQPTDASLTSTAAHFTPARPTRPAPGTCVDEYESSARLITPLEPPHAARPERSSQAPSDSPRTWHAQAWKREREREQREATHHRRSIA